MRLILIGPPGSGKGTQAHWISEQYQLPHLSTGDMIRDLIAQASEQGKQLSQRITQGQLIPDAEMIELIKARITQADCHAGFILDGFPRTLPQMEQLHNLISIDVVIEFVVPNHVIIERFSGRRIHPQSGRIYHTRHSPPKTAGYDDLTGEPLVQRIDDNEATIKERLRLYEQHTQPVSRYYQKWAKGDKAHAPTYYSIATDRSITDIHQEVYTCLSNHA